MKGISLIRKIKTAVEDFVEVKIVKIRREANKIVNDLTKYSLNLCEDIVEFTDCSNFLLNVFLSDIRGIGRFIYFCFGLYALLKHTKKVHICWM